MKFDVVTSEEAAGVTADLLADSKKARLKPFLNPHLKIFTLFPAALSAQSAPGWYWDNL